jgi:hypothetical protein
MKEILHEVGVKTAALCICAVLGKVVAWFGEKQRNGNARWRVELAKFGDWHLRHEWLIDRSYAWGISALFVIRISFPEQGSAAAATMADVRSGVYSGLGAIAFFAVGLCFRRPVIGQDGTRQADALEDVRMIFYLLMMVIGIGSAIWLWPARG